MKKVHAPADRYVNEGDLLITIGDNKEETDLVSPFGGKITAVHAAEGSNISDGDFIVTIEP